MQRPWGVLARADVGGVGGGQPTHDLGKYVSKYYGKKI